LVAYPRHPALCLLLLASACGSGGRGSSPILDPGPPELVVCRARRDQPHSFAEIALRTAQNLGNQRLADRTGRERSVRLHPDGNTVVFVRETQNNAPISREIFSARIDGLTPEQQLTQNSVRDDDPCWSPDGQQLLFSSELAGPRRLWLMAADGNNRRLFLDPPVGNTDLEPDWTAVGDRVVFSRRDPLGRHRLWLANGDGSGAVPFTDGGTGAGAEPGDRQPSFAPDGLSVAFVRLSGSGEARLCYATVATGAVTERMLRNGELQWPRYSRTGDQLFVGLSEPAAGRDGLRLASLALTAGEPALLWPDERWQLAGIDVLPALGPAPARAPASWLDVREATIQLAAGSSAFGGRQQLVALDGDELLVSTVLTGEGRQVAGINCRFDLPVARTEDVLELQLRAIARITRTGGTSALRMSIYNPVEERFDTAVELLPTDTGNRELRCNLSSLRHLTRQRQLRFTVIGDLDAGTQAELRVDLVEVALIRRQAPL
jgi:hypothetical protein